MRILVYCQRARRAKRHRGALRPDAQRWRTVPAAPTRGTAAEMYAPARLLSGLRRRHRAVQHSGRAGNLKMGLAEGSLLSVLSSLWSCRARTSKIVKSRSPGVRFMLTLSTAPPPRCALPHVARLAHPPNPTTNPPYNSCPTALRASLAQGPAQAAESATTRVALAPPNSVRASPSDVAVATMTMVSSRHDSPPSYTCAPTAPSDPPPRSAQAWPRVLDFDPG
jgi:hypothetical protein